jgi:DNA-binding HxlR family transcriptional regulator
MNTNGRAVATEHAGPCASEPMDRAMRLLGDVWTLMIVHALLGGTRRFGALLEAMGNVSPKTVSHRLKKLEEIGFVQRQAYAEIPPRVEYSLTEKGLALADILEAIRQFGEHYLLDIRPVSPDASCDPSADE